MKSDRVARPMKTTGDFDVEAVFEDLYFQSI